MLTKEFDYYLPKNCIAQRGAEPKDHSRLMIVDKNRETIEHRHFYDIVSYLRNNDLIVWNNSKVFKARLCGILTSRNKEPLLEHTRPIEVLLIRPTENKGVWQALVKPGRHAKHGTRIIFLKGRSLDVTDDFSCDVIVHDPRKGVILVQFDDDEDGVRHKANRYGIVPIPPYIKDEKHELATYQTVYASNEGSVAAPTAGFHFTDQLINQIKKKGIEFASITLHVGLGTFLPVKSERIEDHTMHSERIDVSAETAEKVNQAKKEGRRVVAVGTTTVRALEALARIDSEGELYKYKGDVNLFITPGFQFQIVDAIITNFHLPKSTLLMLVAAFVGDTQFVLHCYREAVRHTYRFYSFGDAMFIY